ncbi:MAG: Ig-like domain-containing protein, partial [Gemmatimonadaceae bacterium]
MRRLIAGALVLAACASPGTPPGGPEDDEAPLIVRVRPDTNAVNVRAGNIGFDFDEVISERAQGVTTLADLFLISPSNGRNDVSWRRTRLEVRPRGGLRPNTTYRVTMLPGLTDLDGNVDSVGASVVFSTGPTLASGRVTGMVFDWLAERPARGATVEAIVLPDSIRYMAMADSMGRYELRNMPPGRYVLRGLVDQNKNRELDPRELFDTLTIALQDSLSRELHAISRDTLGAGIERVDIVDSLTLRVRFDRALDTALTIVPTQFTLKKGDSTVVAIRTAIGGRALKRMQEDSARTKALQDSIRAANDTTKRDSTRAAERQAAAAAAAARARAAARLRAGTPPVDTTPPPKPSVKIPDTEVVLGLADPLPAGTAFRLRAQDMRTVVGHSRSSERTFTSPRPRPVTDSARKDTVGRGPGDSGLGIRDSEFATGESRTITARV